ncbi:MAG: hypothetical protein DHS20C01_02900 [marine bacterium B5-7]|nr:MAG: hypothetical protein DHS20C01_02900 [marine bacterium B5-7]
MQKFDVRNATPKIIREHVIELISEVSGLSVDELEPGMSVAEDIAPNSIDRITLFMALEDEFNESIPESEVRDIITLKQLLDFVELRVISLRNASA